MPAVWTRLERPDFIHYLDEPLASAWLEQTLAVSGADAEAAGNAGTPDAQRAKVLQAWEMLGNALLALDLQPPGVPTYVAAMRVAFGPTYDPALQTVPMLHNPGTIAQAAWRLYAGAHGGADPPPDAWTVVRVELGANARPRTAYVTSEGATEVGARTFGRPVFFDGTPCPYATGDWRCGAYDDPLGGTPAALAPLVLWLRLAHDVATALKTAGPSAVVEAAVRAGARNITGGAAAPTQDVPVPSGWVRPGTLVVGGGSGVGGNIGGGSIAPGVPGAVLAEQPGVDLVSPRDGAVADAPYAIPMAANPRMGNKGIAIARVIFLVNGVTVGEARAAPWTLTSGAVPPGRYTVQARAQDAAGLWGYSPIATVTVQTAAPVPVACALPTNPALAPDDIRRDPYFATPEARDAWIAAHPTCPPPPAWQAPTTGPLLPVACLPAAPLASAAAVAAWNSAHPECPPIVYVAPPPAAGTSAVVAVVALAAGGLLIWWLSRRGTAPAAVGGGAPVAHGRRRRSRRA